MKTIKDVGEFGLIERIRRKADVRDRSILKGIGDDAAVLRVGRIGVGLLTADSLADGVDFHLKKDKPELVGRKLLAINLSDVAAMGGWPRYALLSLGLPPGISVSWFDRFLKGLFGLGRCFEVKLIGGDISRAKQFWASLTLLGEAPRQKWISRSGARPGDLVFVTGTLGGSILGKHLAFTPRIREVQAILKRVCPTSMIDISDGLIQDMGHVLKASRVGAKIYGSMIPISGAARRLGGSPLAHALADGEDFEILFTLRPKEVAKLPGRIFGTKITRVGEIVSRQQGLKFFHSPEDRRIIHVSKKGFVHF